MISDQRSVFKNHKSEISKKKLISDNRPLTSERGNVFLAIFGAVAIIGVLGAGVMNFSQGPVQNAVTLNKKNSSDVDMAMVGQLAIMAATNTANKGDCDNDSYVEPPEYRDAGSNPKPLGGGLVPNSVGVSKKDPWGTEYGYCVWDYGPKILSASCQGASGVDKRLQGNNSKIYPVIAIISAGPDGTFTTTCRNFSTGAARADQNNDGDLDDVGDFPLVSKAAATDDDIIVTYSYEGAMASSGGLWKLRSSDSNTAYLDKKVEAQAATIAGTGTFERIAAIGGDFVDVISGVRLADPLVVTTCNLANTSILRRALSGFGIEICSGSAWTALGGGNSGGGGGPVAGINDLGDGIVLTNNLFGGNNVGNEALTGTNNTGFGVNSLKNLTTGSNNTAFGFEAMREATASSDNTAMGWRAGNKMTGSASKNTAYGYEALMSCTSCTDNTVVGFQSGKMVSTAVANTSAGSLSMLSNTTGAGNTVAGYEALKSATTPASNVVVGWNTGKFLTTSTNNVLIGSQVAGASTATSRTQNVAIGFEAMKNGVDIRDNVAVGTQSMLNATGWNNVGVGHMTLNAANSGNVAVGSSAMGGSTVDSTTGIGYLALALATGAKNTAVGTNALAALTTGTDNTALGYQAITLGEDISHNTVAGSSSMIALGAASLGNTAAGQGSMAGSGVKSNNTGIGFEALKAATATSGNTAVGHQATTAITSGIDNTAVGHQALYTNATGNRNVAIGYLAGRGVTAAEVTVIGAQSSSTFGIAAGSVYAGYNTYPSSAAAALNTVIGYQAMSTSAANSGNVIAGAQAGISPGAENVAIGYQSLRGTGAASNVAIGRETLKVATASSNTAIGSGAGIAITGGAKITIFGTGSGAAMGDENTFFGRGSAGSLTGTGNTSFGHNTLNSAAGSKSNNTAIGMSALAGLTTGSNNTVFAFNSLANVTTGSNNTAVADGTNPGATPNGITLVGGLLSVTANLSNSAAIGSGAAISANNTIRFGNTSVSNISGQVPFVATSDKRVKKDIHPSDLGLDFILKLQPVSYRLIDGNGRLDYGFIAQDIEKALEGRKTNLITRMNDKEKTYKMRGDDLLSPIVKAVQEQQQMLESLEKELDSMR